MEALYFWFILLVGLCISLSSAFPPKYDTQNALFERPELTGTSKKSEQQKDPAEVREQVNTVRVTCHPGSFEIIIKADLFGVGAPVNSDEIRLGVEKNEYCSATASSGDEYTIIVGLVDCGTTHWITKDSLIYTNLLVYTPVASTDGVVRMDDAVIPIECHYKRKYSLSSSSLTPTWIPFMATQVSVEILDFNLRIMTSDWIYERGSNVFHLGEPISIEASVRVGHHMGLRVFLSSCVATLNPDIYSVPRYVFIENGCLVDSQLPGSRSQFLPRTQNEKLDLTIDAFRFHNEDQVELYITCHMNAVPMNDPESLNKACTFVNGRWRSADGNDYLCVQCQRQNEVGQTLSKPSSPSKFGPRGFGKPADTVPLERRVLGTNTVWEQDARLGPMMVLPFKQSSGPIPFDELPPIRDKISRPSLFSSQWRSGVNNGRVDQPRGLLPDSPSTPDQVKVQTFASEQDKDAKSGTDPKGNSFPEAHLTSNSAVLNNNDTASLGEDDTASLGEDDTASLGEDDTASLGEDDTASLGEDDTASLGEDDIGEDDTASLGEDDTASLGEDDIGEDDTASLGEDDIGEDDTASLGEDDIGEDDTASLGEDDTASLGEDGPTAQFTVDATRQSNATATESDLSDTNE
ncbi:zona pellucida sperm-binding protein 3-like isoform X2 [Cottoperca gobio]|uniref:Zona pellucida sperm-binding protein 3 n=1 Tax=Cottoperca gobio TaxID=56716 RepID=A0A6J2Q6I4_COTGO|nr:zona pellucida sperm-binding protein 3-like isoform X2 [Cottoperca gobio]